MANTPLQPIKTSGAGFSPNRVAQLEGGVGNNQQARASDVNPIIDYVNAMAGVNASAVTQATSTATGVTLNSRAGVITMFTSVAATTVGASFVLTNSYIGTSSNVQAWVSGYTGTLSANGFPAVTSVIPAAGSATITVVNTGTNALAGVVEVSFIVF